MDFNIQTIVKEWNRILGKNPKASKQSHIRELGLFLLLKEVALLKIQE